MPRTSEPIDVLNVNGADLSAQIDELRAKLEEMVEHLAASGKTQAKSFADSASAEVKYLGKKARRKKARLEAQAGDLADDAVQFLRHRPMAALGIAAGLGLVIGLFATRR